MYNNEYLTSSYRMWIKIDTWSDTESEMKQTAAWKIQCHLFVNIIQRNMKTKTVITAQNWNSTITKNLRHLVNDPVTHLHVSDLNSHTTLKHLPLCTAQKTRDVSLLFCIWMYCQSIYFLHFKKYIDFAIHKNG